MAMFSFSGGLVSSGLVSVLVPGTKRAITTTTTATTTAATTTILYDKLLLMEEYYSLLHCVLGSSLKIDQCYFYFVPKL